MCTWISKHSKSGEFRRAHVLFCVQMHTCTQCIRPAHVSKDPRIHLHMPFTLAMVHMQHLARECARARGMLWPYDIGMQSMQGKHRNALKALTEMIIFTFSRYNQYI